jgi:hypothetical protein
MVGATVAGVGVITSGYFCAVELLYELLTTGAFCSNITCAALENLVSPATDVCSVGGFFLPF